MDPKRGWQTFQYILQTKGCGILYEYSMTEPFFFFTAINVGCLFLKELKSDS